MTPRVIVLDSTPLSLLCGPTGRADVAACRRWCNTLVLAGHRIVMPEIIDYEVRRELVRAGKAASVARLTALRGQFRYLPLTTQVLERAAWWWADARNRGKPTAPDPALDVDMILVAQAEAVGGANTVIATANVNHLSRFRPAEFWSAITP